MKLCSTLSAVPSKPRLLMTYRTEELIRASCLQCGNEVPYGARSDSKFCCPACRNRYHNIRKNKIASLKNKILGKLETNYEILDICRQEGKEKVEIADLELMGFNRNYMTMSIKESNHRVCGCFDIFYRMNDVSIWKIDRR